MPEKRSHRTASLRHEREYYAQGCTRIVGMDEAGRGAWAGPVAVGAVCLPVMDAELRERLAGVRDSKEMTPGQRARLVERIKDVALAWGVGSASNLEIDRLGIVPAIQLAMRRAFAMLLQTPDCAPDCLFLDSLLWPEMKHIPQVSIVNGDKRSLSIAAASVVAKVWRDAYMAEIGQDYPQYQFDVHKGYGTAKHHAAIRACGPCVLHRMSYAPLRDLNDGGAAPWT